MSGNKKMDSEIIEMKSQNEDDNITLNDFSSNRKQPLQSTDCESTKTRSYRSVTVCLVLLCVLLLTAVIVLCVLIYTNNHQCHIKTKNELRKTLTEADGWIYYQSSLYYISSEQKSWTESRRYCRERGADLIIINNKEEQDFIKLFSKDRHWIGLSDSDEEGRWKWVDGSTLISGFWKSGEPNGGTTENCVESYPSGWNDAICNNAIQWICEKNILK